MSTPIPEDLLNKYTKFDYQPAPLYGHAWPVMSRLPDASWRVITNKNLLFPSNSMAVALRFYLKNTTNADQNLILEIDDLQLDRAKIWLEYANGTVDSSALSGDKQPFPHRSIRFANPNFKLFIPAGNCVQVRAYLDQSGLFLRPRLSLWQSEAFAAYAAKRQLIAGFILGFFCLSLLVYLLAAMFRLIPVAPWYAGFVAVQTLQIATNLGIGHQFLWPASGLFSNLFSVALPLIGFVLLFKMMDHLLDLKQQMPVWRTRFLNCYRILLATSMVAYLISVAGGRKPLLFLYPLVMVIAIGLCFAVIAACLKLWLKHREERYLLFLAAFMFGISGAVFSWLTKMGLPISFNAGRYGVVVGFTVDLLILNYLIFRNLWQTKTKNQTLRLALLEINNTATENLLKGQETERKRLSLDLHDGVGIELGSILRRLEKIFYQVPEPDSAEKSRVIRELANVAEQIRKFSHALDPFSVSNLSLEDLLDNLLIDFESTHPDIEVAYTKNLNGIKRQFPLSKQEKHLFFMASELLNNVSRHAKASSVEVLLTYEPKNIRLEISDNGIGYEPSKVTNGIGLSHLRARAHLSGAIFYVYRRGCQGMTHWIEMPLDLPVTTANLSSTYSFEGY